MSREHWGSQLTFVLAAAGSAVGLGNIWKFPYLVGKNGGGAFLFLYIICLIVIGLPLMLGELLIGRAAQKSPVSAFKELAPGKKWYIVGFLGVLAGFLILSFYSVVAGWSLEFLYQTVTGNLWNLGVVEGASSTLEQAAASTSTASTSLSPERIKAISAFFGDFVSDYHWPLIWHFVFMSICIAVVAAGVKDGIEFWSKLLMPLLFGLVILLIVRVYFLEGSGAGYKFLFSIDWSKIWSAEVVLAALGQAFFSLSLGMGAMITYGSYLSEKESLPKSAFFVMMADSAVAILAGLAIFPAVFAFGLEPTAGPGLVFSTLPVVFVEMTGGRIFGTLFFASLLIAALTSAISLLEVVVAYFIDEFNAPRLKTTVIVAIVIAIMGIPSALCFVAPSESCPMGMKEMTIPCQGASLSFFDFVEHIASNFCLPLGGLLICIFIGWFWGKENVYKNVTDGALWFKDPLIGRFSLADIWFFLIKYVSPVIVAIVFAYSFKIISFANGSMVFFKGWF